MRIVFLGTSSNKPTKYRNVSSIALQLEGETWLFDCGEGTQHQLLRCPTVSVGNITKVFITHMHGDHVLGLPGVLLDIAGDGSSPDLVSVYGPMGLRQFVNNTYYNTHVRKYRFKVTEYARNSTFVQRGDGNDRSILLPDDKDCYHVYVLL
jgi:ribonuclease Z